jgi:hypothetical protein
MSLVNQFEITLKDFLPDRSDGMTIADQDRGTTATVSKRLYVILRAYAADNQVPLGSVVEQLREEIHRPPNAYALTCAKCGHTGKMLRLNDRTIEVTGFESLRVYRNGTVSAKCHQCRANQAIASEPLP